MLEICMSIVRLQEHSRPMPIETVPHVKAEGRQAGDYSKKQRGQDLKLTAKRIDSKKQRGQAIPRIHRFDFEFPHPDFGTAPAPGGNNVTPNMLWRSFGNHFRSPDIY